MSMPDQPRLVSATPGMASQLNARFFMYNTSDMVFDDTTRRALVAYARTDGEPLPTAAGIEKVGGLRYVVLRARTKVIAAYRVRNDGKLKRLVRIPAGIE